MSMFVTSNTTLPSFSTQVLAGASSVAVTPSDSVDLPIDHRGPSRGLQVAGAGNVSVNLNGGGTAVLTGLIAGQTVLGAYTRVLATGTTATGIISLH